MQAGIANRKKKAGKRKSPLSPRDAVSCRTSHVPCLPHPESSVSPLCRAKSWRWLDWQRARAEVAQLQYDNGYTDYLTVLDAQRQLFSSELSLANALRDRPDAVVSVCMALGGGGRDNEGNTPAVPYLQTDELVRAKTGERNMAK